MTLPHALGGVGAETATTQAADTARTTTGSRGYFLGALEAGLPVIRGRSQGVGPVLRGSGFVRESQPTTILPPGATPVRC